MSGFTLHHFQKEPVRKALEFLKKPVGTPYIVAPTGAGKSVMIAKIADDYKKPIVVFQPSAELLRQNFERYQEQVGSKSAGSLFSASAGKREISAVTFATIGTAVSSPELFQHFGAAIIDECHLVPGKKTSQYGKFFKKVKVPVLGLTATPYRLQSFGKFKTVITKLVMLEACRPSFFTHCLHILQNEDLAGYWPTVKYADKGFDSSVLQLNSSGSDFTEKSMQEAAILNETTVKIRNFCIDRLLKSSMKHVLIFVRSIEDAEALAGIVPKSAAVHSKMPTKERNRILSDFKSGKIKFVINVGILTTGFDFKQLQVVILGRPTNSLALYYQKIGRLLRNCEGKPEVYVIDFAGNYKKFGPVEGLKLAKNKTGKSAVFSAAGKQLTGVKLSQFTIPNKKIK